MDLTDTIVEHVTRSDCEMDGIRSWSDLKRNIKVFRHKLVPSSYLRREKLERLLLVARCMWDEFENHKEWLASIKHEPNCSFCGRDQCDVSKLIAGPCVYICDRCVDSCAEIVEEERRANNVTPMRRKKA